VIEELMIVAPAGLDRVGVLQTLGRVAAVRAWLDSIDIALVRRLDELSADAPSAAPEVSLSKVTHASRRDLDATIRRSRVVASVPAFESALRDGAVCAAHVDAVERTMRRLPTSQREAFAAAGERLVALAGACTPERFDQQLRREASALEAAAGHDRLAQQQRACRLRTWTDRASGMLRGSFALDPERGVRVLGALGRAVETLFHHAQPDTCPDDHLERQHHLQALAFVALLEGGTPGTASIVQAGDRCDVVLVVDEATVVGGRHARSRLATGTDLELGVESFRRQMCSAVIVPALVDGDGVTLRLGRRQRLASRGQRRALVAMYETCAIDGCTVPVGQCEPHHLMYWRDGGATDLENLLPLCVRHHHCAHEGGWDLRLEGSRALRIRYPDGTERQQAPPGHDQIDASTSMVTA
jgi:hypothetical protein